MYVFGKPFRRKRHLESVIYIPFAIVLFHEEIPIPLTFIYPRSDTSKVREIKGEKPHRQGLFLVFIDFDAAHLAATKGFLEDAKSQQALESTPPQLLPSLVSSTFNLKTESRL
jgi:hypothetical protein